MKTLALGFAVLLGIMLPTEALPAEAASWKAGVAKVRITPEVPMWMSGYASRDHPAEGKLTDLWAKALAIEDAQGHRAVLVTMDIIGIDREFRDRVRGRVRRQHGLPPERLALCVTHTHTGPVIYGNLRPMYSFDDRQAELLKHYAEQLQDKLVEVVGLALERLQPARLSWGTGRATFAVNRRNNPEAQVPALRAAGKLQGPVDHDVPVLAVHDADDRLQAVVCGYACHATVLSFYQWSGDWPGFAQRAIEKAHPEAVGMVWAGCGADQNPLPRRQVELAQQYGQRLAAAVDIVLQQPMRGVAGTLAARAAEVDLPLARLPSREELGQTLKSNNRYEVNRARFLLEQLDRDGKLAATYPYSVQVWQLGTGPTWAFLAGEVVVDYSLRLKAELGPGTWVAAYSNDVPAYIPSERVLREGGYEGASAMVYYGLPSPWAAGVENRVVGEVVRQAAQTETDSTGLDHRLPMFFVDDDGQRKPVETPDHWQRRRQRILRNIQQATGPLPDRSHLPPLDVKVLAEEKGDGYRRLNVTFTAERDDRISAHLYLPDESADGVKRPAMLALHPTSPLGKRVTAGESDKPNRGYAKELAQRGYVVLAPDYPSFGDYAYDFAADRYVSGTMKGIFNHMRCVDLLAAREEVDPQRIGVIGHSLGGHNAMFVAVFDPRLKVVVSSCGWTPFHDYYEGDITGWTSDRYMPRLRDVFGLEPDRVPFDFAEIVAALAPRPFFSNSPLGDGNFAASGVKKAEAEAGKVYRLYGAGDHLVVKYPDAGHDFPPDVREEAYRWFDRFLPKPTAP